VTVRSSDTTVVESGWTNNDGRCYFYNLPKDKFYNIETTHTHWEKKEIDWKSENFVIIIMKAKNSRTMVNQFQMFNYFPLLRLVFKNLLRFSDLIK
jgi:hypothetical protein